MNHSDTLFFLEYIWQRAAFASPEREGRMKKYFQGLWVDGNAKGHLFGLWSPLNRLDLARPGGSIVKISGIISCSGGETRLRVYGSRAVRLKNEYDISNPAALGFGVSP